MDVQNFLDVKIDGTPRRMDGKYHDVEVYLRDYRPVKDLMVPYLIETTVQGYPGSHKMIIESVAINPKLEDSLFTKPQPK